jgi:DNA-binding SARP family transcriptional activator
MIEATASRVEFRLLGPLEVSVDGRPFALAGARQRALLAYLLIRANEPVATDRLLEELWNGKPPPTASASLRVAVSKLRRAFEDAGAARTIETLPNAYLLRLEPDQTDLHRFEALVERGRSAMRRNNPQEAATLFRQALDLWRSTPLAEFAYESFARNEIARLEELRLSTIEDRIEADLDLGRDADLVPELRPLVSQHPLRERLRSQLMLALYRAGRQQEALDVYRDTREALDEIGLTPGPALQRLERSVLEQSPALDSPARAVSIARRRRATWKWVAAAAVLLAALAVALPLVFVGSSPGVAVSELPPNTLAELDPRSTTANAVFSVGASPTTIAASANAIWVANFEDRTVSRVDPRKHAIETVPETTSAPTALAVGAGAAWVASRFDGQLVRIDPATARPLVAISLAPGVDDVAVGAGGVWVSNQADGTVTRVDPRMNRVTASVRGLAGPVGLATGNGTLWVAESSGKDIAIVDTRTNSVADRIPLKFAPEQLAYANGVLWTTQPLDNFVSRIDLATRDVQVIPVGRIPSAIAASRDFAWVVNDLDHSLYRIDARTGVVDRKVVLSTNSMPPRRRITPGGIATNGANVWLTVQPY